MKGQSSGDRKSHMKNGGHSRFSASSLGGSNLHSKPSGPSRASAAPNRAEESLRVPAKRRDSMPGGYPEERYSKRVKVNEDRYSPVPAQSDLDKLLDGGGLNGTSVSNMKSAWSQPPTKATSADARRGTSASQAIVLDDDAPAPVRDASHDWDGSFETRNQLAPAPPTTSRRFERSDSPDDFGDSKAEDQGFRVLPTRGPQAPPPKPPSFVQAAKAPKPLNSGSGRLPFESIRSQADVRRNDKNSAHPQAEPSSSRPGAKTTRRDEKAAQLGVRPNKSKSPPTDSNRNGMDVGASSLVPYDDEDDIDSYSDEPRRPFDNQSQRPTRTEPSPSMLKIPQGNTRIKAGTFARGAWENELDQIAFAENANRQQASAHSRPVVSQMKPKSKPREPVSHDGASTNPVSYEPSSSHRTVRAQTGDSRHHLDAIREQPERTELAVREEIISQRKQHHVESLKERSASAVNGNSAPSAIPPVVDMAASQSDDEIVEIRRPDAPRPSSPPSMRPANAVSWKPRPDVPRPSSPRGMRPATAVNWKPPEPLRPSDVPADRAQQGNHDTPEFSMLDVIDVLAPEDAPVPSGSRITQQTVMMRAPADDPLMKPSVSSKNGGIWRSLQVELMYFGLRRFSTTPRARYQFRWNGLTLEVKDDRDEFLWYAPVDLMTLVIITSDAVMPMLALESSEKFQKLVTNVKCKYDADSINPAQRQLCLKFVNDQKDLSKLWTDLTEKFNKKMKAQNTRHTSKPGGREDGGFRMEVLPSYAVAGLLATFESECSAEAALGRQEVDRDATKEGRGHPPQPRRLLPTNRDSDDVKCSGTPVAIPSRPAPMATRSSARASVGNRPPSPHQTTLDKMPTRSSARINAPKRPPSPDPNELILVWPESGTGAVNITYGDIKRLAPYEFLNDTLIEFGLKLWLKNFTDDHPELAQDVHVFNTFFYKKLSNKNHEAGYESVRKWTNKIDIFAKKYVIVPINEHLHWYLAIICNPKHVLRPPPPAKVIKPRKSTRLEGKRETASSDMDIDEDPPADQPGTTPQELSTPLSGISAEEAEVEGLAVSTQDMDLSEDKTPIRADSGEQMDVDQQVQDVEQMDYSMSPELGATPDPDPPTVDEDLDIAGAGAVENEADSTANSGVIDTVDGLEPEKTRIFTFDSLAGRHLGAISTLKRYLQYEAKDKKRIEQISEASGKLAAVPTQPNYCDCGLYLLHFVEKFMSDPEKFISVLEMKYRKADMPNWDEVWDKPSVENKRDDIKGRILSLSDDWKSRRQGQPGAQEPQKKAQEPRKESKEDDDDDIEVLHETKPMASKQDGKEAGVKGKGKGKGRPSKATTVAEPAEVIEVEDDSQETQPRLRQRPATRLR